MTTRRVLVTGGTGFIGERLVQKLAARGDEVVVLSRRAGKSKHATQVVWTPTEKGPWLEEVDKADAIIHLAGAGILDKRWTEEHLAMCRESRVVPTRLIAERLAARTANPANAFLCASAVGYYGYRTDDSICDEDLPPGDDVIAKLCADWEGSCAPIEDAHLGTRVVRARIGVVLGPEGGALKQMLPAFRFGVGGPLGSGDQMLPWVSAEDTVNALLFMVDTPALVGAVNITAPNVITMGEFAKALGRTLKRPAVFRVPGFALRIIMGDGADVVLTGQNAPPKKLLAAGFTFETPEIDQALTKFELRS